MSPIEQQQLSETERFAYLQAMDIPLWVPRDALDGGQAVEEAEAIQDDVGGDLSDSNLSDSNIAGGNESGAFEAGERESDKRNISENLATNPSAAPHSTAVSSPTSNAQASTAADSGESQTSQPVAHYLKMVPWSAGVQSNRSVLIICRHQTDQPAQSFARPNSPSQFMTDYIQALREFLDEEKDDCFIKMGHLSQAGLGKGCADFAEVLKEVKPKLILVLGDETVKELFGKDSEVADLRGRTLTFEPQYHCIVSYHPFSLIKNPALKKLALEDLKLSASLLLNG